ncbi:hypothetical protein P7C71_g6026, partial [Lecanoromycetidae sp. Uapishka_2]
MSFESAADSESVTYQSGRGGQCPPELRILHFNDVYHIESGSAEPIGGIARFQTVSNHYRSDPKFANQSKLITLFSGDAFNPSLESSVTKAEKTAPGLIDLILGGHDHFYSHLFKNGTHILRSGTDFKNLSYIEARRKSNGRSGWDFDIIRRDITRAIPEDEVTVKLVEKLTSSLKTKLEKPIGYTAVPLDGRFTTVRTRESNLGNFVCDLMRHYYEADCALMAAGTIRGDQIYPPGVLLLKDILNCFPFEDPVVVVRVKGKAILEALENSVCLVPALEGRYPQVSNIQFKYNPHSPSGSRVLWAKINNEPLDLNRQYTLATRGYMGRGKDGYDSLLVVSEGGTAEEIVSEENGILISMVLRQYFMSLKVLGKWARWSPSLHRHWGGVNSKLHVGGKVKRPGSPENARRGVKHRFTGSVVEKAERTKTDVDGKLVDSDTDDEKDDDVPENLASSVASIGSVDDQKQRDLHLARVYTRRWMDLAGIERDRVGMVGDVSSEWLLPHWTQGIAPKLEGRILVEGVEQNGIDGEGS